MIFAFGFDYEATSFCLALRFFQPTPPWSRPLEARVRSDEPMPSARDQNANRFRLNRLALYYLSGA